MSGPEEAAREEPWAAERSIVARLVHHGVIDDIDGVEPSAFVLVVARLGQFKKRPITDRDMTKMKQQGRDETERRKALNLAAGILRNEIKAGKWDSFPSFGERVRRWEEAVAVLRMPRGATDNPHDWLTGAKQGDAMRAWSYMATDITGYTLQALRPYRTLISLRHTSGMIKFILEALTFIDVNNLPAPTTLSTLLRKNLARTGIL